MKKLFFLIFFLPVVMFGQSVSTSIKTDRIYSKIGRGISIYDTVFIKKGIAADSLENIQGIVCRNSSDGRLVYVSFAQFVDSIGGFSFSGDTIFIGGDTLIIPNYWTLTGSDISNNNAGKVILPKDSTYFSGIPDVATKVGRILHVNQYGKIEYLTPATLADTLAVSGGGPWTQGTGVIYQTDTTDRVDVHNLTMEGLFYEGHEKAGDINNNGTISGTDATIIINYLSGIYNATADQKMRMDLDGDGLISWTDKEIIQGIVLSKYPNPLTYGIDSLHRFIGKKLSGLDVLNKFHIKTHLALDSVSLGTKDKILVMNEISETTELDYVVKYIPYDSIGGGGVTAHGDLTGLDGDDHSQYALLKGRSGDNIHLDSASSLSNSAHIILSDYEENTGQIEIIANKNEYDYDAAINMNPEEGITISSISTKIAGYSGGESYLYSSGLDGNESKGHFKPQQDNTYDLGTTSAKWNKLFTKNISDYSDSLLLNVPTGDYDTTLVMYKNRVYKSLKPTLWNLTSGKITNDTYPVKILTSDATPYAGNHDLTLSTISTSIDNANLAIGFEDAVGDTTLAAIVVHNEGNSGTSPSGWMDMYFRENSGTDFVKKFSFGNNYENDESMMKIYTPYTESAPTADYTMMYNSSTGDVVMRTGRSGYTLPIFVGSHSAPADATTYYFGPIPNTAPSTTAEERKVYIPKAGKITFCSISSNATTAGTDEAWPYYIRLNNSTDYGIDTVSVSANLRQWINSAMDITVAAGDYIEIKSVTPTWATNPAGVSQGGYLYIEQ